MILCALFSRLFRSIDYAAPWTRRSNHGGGPYLDELLARRARPITIPNPATGEPIRIGMYLELQRGER